MRPARSATTPTQQNLLGQTPKGVEQALTPPITRSRDRSYLDYRNSWLVLTDHDYDPPRKYTDSQVNKQAVFKGRQITTSEGHPFRTRNKRVLTDIGGDFTTTNTHVVAERQRERHGIKVHPMWGKKTIDYNGPLYPVAPYELYVPPKIQSSDSELWKYGATAIARCKPTNSVADVSTALGEIIKDGLPSLVSSSVWKERTLSAKKSSNEYLNVQFGWLPLVSDIQKVARAIKHADTVMKQYERDAGKVVRRNYDFPVQRTTSSYTMNNRRPFTDPTNSYMWDPSSYGTVVVTESTVTRRWFSGAFTYYLPSGYDSRNAMDRAALQADKLFGLTPTPETIWNLAPWSWAIDWFSNAGDVVSNITDFTKDGLVLRYGYIMEHSIRKVTYSMPKTGLYDPTLHVAPLSVVTETKVRRRANPFGFGVSWNGLSPRQLSIAAALGISRR